MKKKNLGQKTGEEWVSLMESRKAIKSGRMRACPLEPLKVNSRLLLSGFELVCSTRMVKETAVKKAFPKELLKGYWSVKRKAKSLVDLKAFPWVPY